MDNPAAASAGHYEALRGGADDDVYAESGDPMYAVDRGLPQPVNEDGGGAGGDGGGKSPSKHPRLQSLDAFRGLVVVWMILVDDAGGTYKHVIDHSPWDHVTLADGVFPLFLFITGFSVALSYRRLLSQPGNRGLALRKATVRLLKLFLIGIVSQGTVYPFRDRPTWILPGCDAWCYVFDLRTIRVPGILQRIGIGYWVASVVEIFLRPSEAGGGGPNADAGPLSIVLRHWKQWLAYLAVTGAYLGVMYGLDVPGCGRGHLTEECNAAREVDRRVLGYDHMYSTPTYVRSASCSPCHPQPWSECLDRPFEPAAWCSTPFDPEGTLTSVSAATSSLLGLAFGHALVERKEHGGRVAQWVPMSLFFLGLGLVLSFAGVMPLNKNLWTTSYVLFWAGVAGFGVTAFYVLIDVWQIRAPFQPLRWVGLNTIFVFTMAATGVFDTALGLVYTGSPGAVEVVERYGREFFFYEPSHSLVWLVRDHLLVDKWNLGPDAGVMVFVWLKIAFWLVVSGVMYRRGIFFKV